MQPLHQSVASGEQTRSSGRSRLASERGQALLETAITIPLVLFVAVAIFEFGRAYQTFQVVTNAAREGARIAVLAGTTNENIEARVRDYLRSGGMPNASTASVAINRMSTVSIGTGTASASSVTVGYPFSFIVLNPVANLMVRGSLMGSTPFTISSLAQMRNEAQ